MNKVLLLFFLFFSVSVFAQNDCERNLLDAKADYNTGNLYAIPGKLTDCLDAGFSKAEKVDAYRLLTLTYLNINQNEKAKESLIKLLNIKTDFRVLPNIDPPELYSLYRKIDTDPQYFIGAVVGINYNTIQMQNDRSNSNISIEEGVNTQYIGLRSYQLGAQYIMPLFSNFWLKAEAVYQNQRYAFDQSRPTYIDVEDPENTEDIKYSYTSRNNGVNISLSARSIIDKYYWKPFVEYGLTGRYNISHEFNDYVSKYSEDPDAFEFDEPIEMDEFRRQFNFGFHLHIGSMFKMWEYYGEVKVGASKFLLSHANEKDDFERKTATIGNLGELMDSDYNNLIYQVNLSFNIPFFKFQ